MSLFLGIDTSNYTTSCALYDSEIGKVTSLKKLLPVKSGEKVSGNLMPFFIIQSSFHSLSGSFWAILPNRIA